MAEPHFTSQQSEALINVSENHSSPRSSPLAEANVQAQTHVERSPSIQASVNPAFIPESSAEIVEDSYKESLRNPVPAQPNEDKDDAEDLYTVSPNGQAKLETTIAAAKRSQEQQV
jgi:hypothetical protein